jgi:hypothetical protein
MYTLNIYRKNEATGQNEYSHSIQKDTRKQCLSIAQTKYADLSWDWDDKNRVKTKKFLADSSTTVKVGLANLIG